MTGNFTDPADLVALRAQAPVMQEKYLELGKRCLETYGENLKYLGTTAAVRDIVAMADVLDGRGSLVNFIGLSYGTIMGNWLINMFPEVSAVAYTYEAFTQLNDSSPGSVLVALSWTA